jgi:alkyl hydroperoxide reductase subunit AhpF
MPISYIYNKLIRKEMEKLKKPVQITFILSKNEENNDYLRSILNTYSESSGSLLTINEIAEKVYFKDYGIEYLPAILFVNDQDDEIIRYQAVPFGAEIKPFVDTLITFSGEPNYYGSVIQQNLDKIDPSVIKVMITESCAYCPEIVSFVNQFAIASNGKIKSQIIDIMVHPEIGNNFDTLSVPMTVINDKKKFEGMIGPNEVLKELMRGN